MSNSIWLPISCHFLISFIISAKIAFLGHSKRLSLASPQDCCWYIIKGLLEKQGQYIVTILRRKPCVPWILVQHHQPKPVISSPGGWVQWAIWL